LCPNSAARHVPPLTRTRQRYHSHSLFSMLRPRPISTLFPYTTLFRSQPRDVAGYLRSLRQQLVEGLPPLGLHPVHEAPLAPEDLDRKSTRLNSSHEWISYAVFCLKKKRSDNGGTSTSMVLVSVF